MLSSIRIEASVNRADGDTPNSSVIGGNAYLCCRVCDVSSAHKKSLYVAMIGKRIGMENPNSSP